MRGQVDVGILLEATRRFRAQAERLASAADIAGAKCAASSRMFVVSPETSTREPPKMPAITLASGIGNQQHVIGQGARHIVEVVSCSPGVARRTMMVWSVTLS